MRNKKVVVAMSGGLDSSVSAALLKRAGFDLCGIFMKFWSEPEINEFHRTWNRCCSPEAESKAREVAKILNIPFYVFNFEKEFKKRIVDYFLRAYKSGLTPNPCVICNKEIKFGLLLEKALSLEADFIATGHYARIKKFKNEFHLLQGKDKNKDQSYFLWMLNQNQLKRILFPIGDYNRDEVKTLAKKFKLPVLSVPKSMEICFVKTTINDFLKKYLKERAGKIIDTKGKTIGEHQGLYFYTIGQRKGIRLQGGPYWVLDKNLKKNILIVTKNEKDLVKKELLAKKVHWISGKLPSFPLKVKAKIRYRHRLSQAMINLNKHKSVKVLFKKPQKAITSGQSVVFYKGQELFGGGIIEGEKI